MRGTSLKVLNIFSWVVSSLWIILTLSGDSLQNPSLGPENTLLNMGILGTGLVVSILLFLPLRELELRASNFFLWLGINLWLIWEISGGSMNVVTGYPFIGLPAIFGLLTGIFLLLEIRSQFIPEEG